MRHGNESTIPTQGWQGLQQRRRQGRMAPNMGCVGSQGSQAQARTAQARTCAIRCRLEPAVPTLVQADGTLHRRSLAADQPTWAKPPRRHDAGAMQRAVMGGIGVQAAR